MKEHEDFQEKIQLSANIEFEFSKEQNFKGLDTFETEIKKRVKKNKSKKEKNLFAYKFFDGTFHKLFFSRSDNYTDSSFERVPEYDTSEEIE